MSKTSIPRKEKALEELRNRKLERERKAREAEEARKAAEAAAKKKAAGRPEGQPGGWKESPGGALLSRARTAQYPRRWGP